MSRLVDVGYAFGALAYAPALLYQIAVQKKHRGAWGERFGGVPRRASERPCVWIHAVSVGEVNATRRVTAQLREAVPDADVVISTTTDTGYAQARTLYPELTVFRYPLDFSVVVRRVMDRIRPTLIVLMELEVWYNLLAIADWRHGDDPTEHISWLRQYWASLEPFTKGFYSNDSGVEATDATVHANYGRNYKRLVAIKNKYDPTNLFRLNANVEPTV